ncbi:hypothetical protein ACOTJF_18175 [Achromobacter ruhlandii]|uniref:hypothetical protein n=1 Tax=Achromobacter ruhlandii TaxID=72557 RepID=UPI003B9FABEC
MNREQLEAIATRKTTCHPFGESVTLSRAERDQLVRMAAVGMNAPILKLALDYITGIEDDYTSSDFSEIEDARHMASIALAQFRDACGDWQE